MALAVVQPSSESGVVVSVSSIVSQAITAGASVEVLERLLALQERWEATQARKAFDAAMSELRADLPRIVKSCHVDFGAGRAAYQYEDLAVLTEALSPVMAKVGLSFRWRTRSEARLITVTCVVAHRDGHMEETTLSCPTDESGSKNPIQAIGSAVSYLQRYTLKAAVGVAAARDDEQGVLILSQFTGAARELAEALIINPYDLEQSAAAMHLALGMPVEEQRVRMRSMRNLVQEFNVYRWAGRMLMDASRMRHRRRVVSRARSARLLSARQ